MYVSFYFQFLFRLERDTAMMSTGAARSGDHHLSRRDTSSMLFSPETSMAVSSLPSPSSTTLEMEVTWDARVIRSELRLALHILSQRGLKLAQKWAAEQLIGLPRGGGATEPSSETMQIFEEYLSQPLEDVVLYAKSLMDVGEYAHAASVLSLPFKGKLVLTMTDPLPNLSPFGIYLRAYALYLAGERSKEEEIMELQGDSQQKHKSARNPFLGHLCTDLESAYHSHRLDAFGLYIYGVVLKEAKKADLPLATEHPPASDILIESILMFPYNWSAWLDLAALSLESVEVERVLEERLAPTLAGNYMYHFFCAHIMAEHQIHEDAMMLFEKLMDPGIPIFHNSPFIVAKLGVSHYHLRQFERARECFEQLHEKDPYRLEDMDVYSNILYVKEDRVTLSQLAHMAVKVDKYSPESCCIVGNYYSLKQQRAKAVIYFERAIKLDRNYISAWTLMGHEFIEMKNTAAAMDAYRRAIDLAPKDYRAWYGLRQTYEFLNMFLYALFYYRKAVALRPYDARMWCAIGSCFLALNKEDDAIRSYERAVNYEDSEGIATQKLASLYRTQRQPEKAARCYIRHLELRYIVTNPHPIQDPTLDIIVQGITVDAPEAEALLYLAHYHRNHGEYETSVLFCSRLLEYPGPEKEEAKGLMRELRSRKAGPPPRRMHTRSQGPPPASPPNREEDSSFDFSP